jgi:hypothetical protein
LAPDVAEDLAQSLFAEKMDTALFLRAERQVDGPTHVRLSEDKPLPTSYGEDVYRRIFESDSRVCNLTTRTGS